MSDDETSAYAAAELGDVARGDLDLGKAGDRLLRDHAAAVPAEDVDWISYLDGLLQEDDRVEGGLSGTALGDLVLQGRATRVATEAARDSNTSQLKALTGLTSSDGDGGDVLSAAADRLSDEGAIALVYGPPGAGKTSLVLDVAVVWRAVTGGTIVSNIQGWPAADVHATSASGILDAMGSTRGPVLAVLDEVREALKADNRKQAEQFAEALRLVRKKEDDDAHPKRGSAIMVAHTQMGTAPGIRRLASMGLRKPERRDPGHVQLLDSVGGIDEWEVLNEYSGVTDTAEDFRSHEASEFVVDLGDDGDRVEDDPDAVRDVVETRTAIVRVLQGQSQSDAAVGLESGGRGWVGQRWREWRDGGLRDVLPLDDVPLPDDPDDDDLPQGTAVDDVHGLD